MLHIYSSNELSDSNMFINEEPLERDMEEKKKEEDQYIRGLTELRPLICPRCEKYSLKADKYFNKDVWFCENIDCGYLCPYPECYSKLPDPSKRSHQTVLRCPRGHFL